ncbi:hypothetical protein SAMN02949497_3423 [Methylomagnum ishizawai]|uniref:Uncharacterized protein n=1 Tax=Methylomagnum ishizawai TaxID=1760988 RepID=A0A1Y6D5A3_9GAMM|nr:hypothetical protein [Methylomagnum ishizawai]SMF96043.1 hypothetical protein SAMN02949497_3423 [Methylomagnum ishizawai]
MNGWASRMAALPAFAWAARPSAQSYAGRMIRVTDYGVGHGSLWFSDGSAWRLVAPTEIYNATTDFVGTYAGATLVAQAMFPAGLLRVGDVLALVIRTLKSGTADAFARNIRFGGTGDIGVDGSVFSLGYGSTNTHTAENPRLKIVSATSIRVTTIGSTASFSGGTSTVGATDTTIPDITANNNYLSITFNKNSGSAGETLTTKELTIIHHPGP